MKIGIDLHAVHQLMQGSRTYIYQLAMHLASLEDSLDLVLYVPSIVYEEFKNQSFGKHVTCEPIPHSRIGRLLTKFPRQCARSGIDLLHVQYIAPFGLAMPYVVSLHDILHETYPQFYPRKIRRLMSLLYPLSARRAHTVLALSEFTKSQVMSLYNIPAERIEVVYPGVSHEFYPRADSSKILAVMQKYAIDGDYILYVGRIEPRKNIQALIQAVMLLDRKKELPCKLVVAGMMDPMLAEYYHSIRSMAMSDKILFTGGVAQEDLPYLYSGAKAFVYPSHGEGFGLPVIEAMACGTPVIASNVTSLPEAVGDAGIMVDPQDTEALAAAIGNVLGDASLRKQMAARGVQHAAKFSWKGTAAQVFSIYQRIHAEM